MRVVIGVQKVAFVQTILSTLLDICTFALTLAGIFSAKTKGINMEPIWGFDKSDVIAAEAATENISDFVHEGTSGIMNAIYCVWMFCVYE